MRKNKRTPRKMNVVVRSTARLAAVLLVLLVMVLINFMASSSQQELVKAIGEKKRELVRLEDERNRAAVAWEAMKTPEKIDRALLNRGIAMRPPRPNQNVYMKSDGTPYVGQYSVRSSQRRNAGQTAQFSARRR